MADEAFDYMIVLDDGETFGYLEGARVLKVPHEALALATSVAGHQQLVEYIKENLKYADPLQVVPPSVWTMITQRTD